MDLESDEYELLNLYTRQELTPKYFHARRIYDKLFIGLRAVLAILFKDISGLQQYFEKISVKHSVRRMRTGFKFGVIYGIVEILRSAHGKMQCTRADLSCMLLYYFICILIYGCTFRVRSYGTCILLSLTYALLHISIRFWSISATNKLFPMADITDVLLLQSYFLFTSTPLDSIIAIIMVYLVIYRQYVWIVYVLKYRTLVHKKNSWWLTLGSTSRFAVLVLVYLVIVLGGLHLYVTNFIRQRVAFLFYTQRVKNMREFKKQVTKQTYLWHQLFPKSIEYRIQNMFSVHHPSEHGELEDGNIGVHKAHLQSGISMHVELNQSQSATILSAHLVGLKQVVATTKNPDRLIDILTQLYALIDSACDQANCEKLAISGNTYWAVCTSESQPKQHWVCVINLGLAICRLVRKFRKDMRCDLWTRVGIHTGFCIYSGIVGQLKPTYSLFSPDLFITRQVERSGRIGFVHISETTYRFCESDYVVATGNSVQVRANNRHGPEELKAYFIDPQSPLGHLKTRDIFNKRKLIYDDCLATLNNIHEIYAEFHRSKVRQFQTDQGSPSAGKFHQQQQPQQPSSSSQNPTVNLLNQTTFMNNLYTESTLNDSPVWVMNLLTDLQQTSKSSQMTYVRTPIHSWSLNFLDSDLERQFKQRMNQDKDCSLFDSDILAFGVDMIMVYIHNVIVILITFLISFAFNQPMRPISLCSSLEILSLSILLCILIKSIVWIEAIHTRRDDPDIGHQTWRSWMIKPLNFGHYSLQILCLLPTLHIMIWVYWLLTVHNRQRVAEELLITLEILSSLTYVLPTWNTNIQKLIGVVMSSAIIVAFDCVYSIKPYTIGCIFQHDLSTCNDSGHTSDSSLIHHWMELLFVIYLVYKTGKESEEMYRLMYYHKYRSDEQIELTNRSVKQTNKILFSIIPEKLLNILQHNQLQTNEPFRIQDYWQVYYNIAVAFISISNFYELINDSTSQLVKKRNFQHKEQTYQESQLIESDETDDDDGNNNRNNPHERQNRNLVTSSKHDLLPIYIDKLHQLMCTFDQLFQNNSFNECTKIKSIENNYLIVAGLKPSNQVPNNSISHLTALMQLCLVLMNKTDEFNQTHFGNSSNGFELAIGYDFGTLIAGIVGLVRPNYDVWGEAISYARVLMMAKVPDCVAVFKNVRDKFGMRFEFMERQEIELKSGDKRKIYGCYSRYD